MRLQIGQGTRHRTRPKLLGTLSGGPVGRLGRWQAQVGAFCGPLRSFRFLTDPALGTGRLNSERSPELWRYPRHGALEHLQTCVAGSLPWDQYARQAAAPSSHPVPVGAFWGVRSGLAQGRKLPGPGHRVPRADNPRGSGTSVTLIQLPSDHQLLGREVGRPGRGDSDCRTRRGQGLGQGFGMQGGPLVCASARLCRAHHRPWTWCWRTTKGSRLCGVPFA